MKNDNSAILIKCECGAEFKIPMNKEWEINLMGNWEFRHNCGQTITLPFDIKDKLPQPY